LVKPNQFNTIDMHLGTIKRMQEKNAIKGYMHGKKMNSSAKLNSNLPLPFTKLF